MKRPFPDPFPRQREQLALGKGTWQEALESPPGDPEVDISAGPEMCQAWCPVFSRATLGHLNGTRSQDHPSHTSPMVLNLIVGDVFHYVLCDFITCFPITPSIPKLQG